MDLSKSVIGKWLCSLAGLVGLASGAQAQVDADWLYHIRVGGLIGLNVRASFSTRGQLNLAGNLPAGVYDDGYVRTDQTGNAGGLTSFWGYQNASQISLASHSLLMHQTTTFSATSSGSNEDAPYVGVELAGGANFLRGERWRLGGELGFLVLPINIQNQQNSPVNVNRNVYSYDTGNIIVPAAPYNGGSSGFGPLINATGRPLAGDTMAGAFTGTQTLDATLLALKLGPTLYWEANRYLGFQVGGGPAVGIVPGSLKFDDTVKLPDGTSPHQSGSVGSTQLTYGGYINVLATFQIHTNADVYLGGQYLPLGNVNFGGGGRNAELHLTGQINFMAGINWHF